MRILEVAHRFPPRTGGVETHVYEISRRLQDMGHDVMVVEASRGPGEPLMDEHGGLKVIRHNSIAPGGAYHFSLKFLVGGYMAKWPDVIHAHNYHSFPAVLVAQASRVRTVLTPHYHDGGSTPLRNALLLPYQLLGRRAVRRSAEVIAMTEWEAGVLRNSFGVDPVVIPNGLDYPDRPAEPFDLDRPYALSVGLLGRHKRVEDAIAAMQHLEDMDLVVVGEGPREQRLREEAISSGVHSRVHFAGRVSDGELASLYTGAECLVVCSERESFGMVVGEALSHGTPAAVVPNQGLERWRGVWGVETAGPFPEAVAGAVRRARDGERVDERPVPDWDEVAERTEEVLTP